MFKSANLSRDIIGPPSPKVRVWLLLGLALLPFIVNARGLRAYPTAEVWCWLRPTSLHATLATLDGQHALQRDMFRPFQEVVIPIEYELFGTNPIVPRTIQFATYSAICLLVFLILQALSKNFLASFTGALLYAVMPCHAVPCRACLSAVAHVDERWLLLIPGVLVSRP